MTDTAQYIRDIVPVPYCVSVEVKRSADTVSKLYHIHIVRKDLEHIVSDEIVFNKSFFPFLATAYLPERWRSEVRFSDYILSNYEKVGFYIYEPIDSNFSSYYKQCQKSCTSLI